MNEQNSYSFIASGEWKSFTELKAALSDCWKSPTVLDLDQISITDGCLVPALYESMSFHRTK